ncbi:(+)-germacrene D synthase-like [Selaginella moellendorffii]|uniref:(+)-germacrene D synthase-like n=1 Tax=Selaginella moellendorffii TaxID=88036 RepID=UPI000D1C67C1|nr:(+)-germacrene D synthase-like [Selaginella moellendorffii]|eukprot:XP_024538239.1 (+)-germacrene D synthase-like [Selaginella moellendorffii]
MAVSSIASIFAAEKSYSIPPVCQLLVSPVLNPLYDAKAESQIDAWCAEFLKLQPGSEKAVFVQESRLGLLAAYVYPTIPYEKIVPVGKFFASFFLADDILDSPEISSSDMRNVAIAYKMVLKGRYDEATLPVKNPELLRQMKMLSEVLEELSLHVVDESGRFVDAMTRVLDMFEIESSWLRKQIIPNLDTYLWLREITSGVAPCFALIDGLLQLRLEERGVLDHPLIRKVEEIGTHHIALHNDLMSLRKEWASGNYLNAVPILASNRKCGLNEAIGKVASMVEDLEKDFAQTKHEIISSGLAMKQGVMDYVNGIEVWMAGNVEWGWTTARYHGIGWIPPPEKSGTFQL